MENINGNFALGSCWTGISHLLFFCFEVDKVYPEYRSKWNNDCPNTVNVVRIIERIKRRCKVPGWASQSTTAEPWNRGHNTLQDQKKSREEIFSWGNIVEIISKIEYRQYNLNSVHSISFCSILDIKLSVNKAVTSMVLNDKSIALIHIS